MFDYEAGIDKLYPDGMLFTDGTMLVAHNAFASVADGWTIHPMQQYDFTHQFYYGARGFMIDVYEDDGELVLLHNKNLKNFAGVGSSVTKTFYLEDFLRGIKNLLDKHEQSVITLIIENKGVSQSAIKSSIIKTKLEDYLLQKDPNDPNLTFGEMRKSHQRLLVFAENGYKTEKGIYSTLYYKETTYSLERDKLCVDRGENRVPFEDSKVKILVMNHFYTTSCASPIESSFIVGPIANTAKTDCKDANSYTKIVDRMNLCMKEGNKPTFIAVDFIEQGKNGGALKAVSDLVDKSFYEEYLQYSKKEKPYRYKIDSDIIITSIISFATGSILTWAYCYNFPQNLPQHVD